MYVFLYVCMYIERERERERERESEGGERLQQATCPTHGQGDLRYVRGLVHLRSLRGCHGWRNGLHEIKQLCRGTSKCWRNSHKQPAKDAQRAQKRIFSSC